MGAGQGGGRADRTVSPRSISHVHPRPRLLVISQAFDQAAVANLGTDFLIDGLRLDRRRIGRAAIGFDLRSFRQPSLGALSWMPRQLGNEARARIEPAVFVMLAPDLRGDDLPSRGRATKRRQEIKRQEAEARYSATHDDLTGLPNRSVAVAAIDEAIAKRAEGEKVAAIFVDLDRFKDVDDTYGHQTGDRLLKQVAALFEECAGDHLLARVGGDEFVVRRRRPQSRRRSPATSAGRSSSRWPSPSTSTAASFRSAPASASRSPIRSILRPQELLRRADVAMDQAKQQGSNRFFVYEPFIDTVGTSGSNSPTTCARR